MNVIIRLEGKEFLMKSHLKVTVLDILAVALLYGLSLYLVSRITL